MSARAVNGRSTNGPRLAAVAAVLAVVAAAAAVVAVTGRDEAPPAGGGQAASTGMAHVHGLGIDPGSGELLAGTHYGTFRVREDGTAEQVGPTQDYMGFTVVGPDHYLASGHPGAGQDAPPNLGLIESTDGGRSWQTKSLAGEADFHTLEARDGRIYGHTAGSLLVSDDGTRWDERARIALADLAVSPDDTDTLLATTQQGLAISSDGGRTFDLVQGAPVMVLVAWDDDGTITGVDLQGGVHASEDGGRTWQERGTVGGQPAALATAEHDVYVATADGRILESADGGTTFTERYREG